MNSKGYEWRRMAQIVGKLLWASGERGKAHLLFREVIKDGRLEAAETN